MMTRKVSISSVKASLKMFRHLAFAFVFLFAAWGAWGETYYWVGKGADNKWTTNKNWDTNPNGEGVDAYPGENDIVYIIDGSTITLTANTTIQNLNIANQNNKATLNLAGNSLEIDTLNLGTGNNATTYNYNQMQGMLIICSNTNQSVSVKTFDICDAGNNYLELQNISCEIQDNYWVNGGGHTIITGDSLSSFAHHSVNYDGGSSVEYQGEMGVGEYGSTIFQVSTSGTPAPGSTVKITISAQTTFTEIYYKLGRTGTEEYSLNCNLNYNVIERVWTPDENSYTIILEFPASIAVGNGITFDVYSDNNELSLLNRVISYTRTSDTTVWTGNVSDDWTDTDNWDNGVPVDDSNVVINTAPNSPVVPSPVTLKSLVNNGNVEFSDTVSINGDFINHNAVKFTNSVNITGKCVNYANLEFCGSTTETGEFINKENAECYSYALIVNGDFSNAGTGSFDFITVNGKFSNTGTIGRNLPINQIIITGDFINTGFFNVSQTMTLSGNFSDTGDETSVWNKIILNGSSDSQKIQTFSGSSETTSYEIEVNKPDDGEIQFLTAMGPTRIYVADNNYHGKLIFKGDGNQTLQAVNNLYESIEIDKTSGTFVIYGSLYVSSFTHIKGDIKFASDYGQTFSCYNTSNITEALFNTDYKVTFLSGTEMNPSEIIAKNIRIGSVVGEYVAFRADETVSIKSMTVKGIYLSNTTGSAPYFPSSVIFSGDININGDSDFIIDYPILLSGDTSFNVTQNLIIQEEPYSSRTGSIKSYSTSGKDLSLTANSIQIKNGNSLGDSGDGKLGTLTINSDLGIDEATQFYADTTIFADTKELTGTELLTINGNTEIDDTAEWTFNNPISVTGDLTNNGTAIFKGAVEVNGGITNAETGDASFAAALSGNTITNNGIIHLNGGDSQTISGTMENGSSSTIDYCGTGTLTSLVWDGDTSATGKQYNNLILNQKTTLGDDITIAGDFTINDETTSTANITVGGDWTNTSTFKATGGTVTFTAQNAGDDSSISVTGDNTFNNLSASGLRGKTITFKSGKTQTVNGALELTGTAVGNELTLKGTGTNAWSINTTNATSTNIEFVKVEKSSSAESIAAANSIDLGGNTNWLFPGMKYKWVGGKSGSEYSWNEPDNWEPKSVPGKGSSVIIQKGMSYYPELTGDLDLYDTGSDEGEITIEESSSPGNEGKLYIGGYTVTVKNFINNGLINLTGIAGQIVINGGTKTLGNNSTVEYEGTGTFTSTNLVWGTDYANLIIKRDSELDDNLTATTISIENPFTFNGTSITTTGTQIYKDTVILKNPTELTARADTTNSTIEFVGEVTGTINSGTTLTINADTIIKTDSINTNDAQTYNGKVTLQKATTLTAKADTTNKNITFIGDVTGTTTNNTTLTINADTIINTSAINTNDAQTYNGKVTLQKATTLTAKADTTNKNITFIGDVTGTTNANTTLIINADTIINTDAINTNDAQTYNGKVTLQKATTLTAKADTTNKNITFIGDVTGTTNSGTTLTINANTIINTSAINTNAAQTYNGTVTLQKATTLTAKTDTTNKDITFIGDVTGTTTNNTTLTINADTIINTSAINTTAAQTYNGTVTLQKAATLTAKRNNTRYNITFAGDVSGTTSANTSLTVDANAIINTNAINTNDAQTYNGTISLRKPVTLTAINGTTKKSLTFKGNITGTTNANTTFYVNGDTILNAASINTNAAQTYNGTVTLQRGATLTAKANTTNKNITFIGDVTGTTNSGTTLTINADTIINTSAINTNDAQTYNGTIILQKAATFTAKKNNTRYNITFAGDVTGTTNADTSLTVDANAIINTDAINTNDAQTYNGTVTLQKATTLTAKADTTNKNITFAGDVTGTTTNNTTLTINADTVINTDAINTNDAQTYNGIVQIDKDETSISSSTEIDFAKNISGDGKKLIVNTPIFTNIATAGNNPTITLDELEFSQDTSIQTQNTTTINFVVPKISGTNETVTLESGTKLAFTENVSIEPGITALSGSTLTAPSVPSGTNPYSMTFKSNINFADGTFVHSSGTVILAPDTVDTISVAGESTFFNLTAQNLGGKTIKFEKDNTQIVEGKLILTGASSTSKLYLRSSATDNSQWEIKCTGENGHTIQYVDIQDGLNTSETGTPTAQAYNLFALNSSDNGNNTNWNFPGNKYKWKGGSGASETDKTDWNNPDNWEQDADTSTWQKGSIPGVGAVITIPGGKSYYPILTQALNLNASYGTPSQNYTGKITVAQNAIFDLAEESLTVEEIINNGHVKLVGKSNQISAKMKNGNDSKVEYCGGTFESFAWDGDYGANTSGKQYANLILNETITQPNTEVLNVSGLTTIKTSSTLDNSLNVFANHVKIGDSNATPSINAGTVVLNGTAGKDAGNNDIPIFLENNILANSLKLNSNVQGTTLTITVTDPLIINASSITTTGTQTYNGSVSLIKGEEITFTAKNGSTLQSITFNNPVTGTTAGTKLTADGNVILNTDTVTTPGDQTYKGTVTLKKAGDITLTANDSDVYQTVYFNGNIGKADTGTHNLIVNAKTGIDCFDINVSSIDFKKQVTLSKDTKITTDSGEKIHFEGALTGAFALETVTGSSLFDGEITSLTSLKTDATARFNAAVSAGTLSTQDAEINCTAINTTGSQSFGGDVILFENVTLNTNDTTNGNISFGSKVNSKTGETHSVTINIPTQRTAEFIGKVGDPTAPSVIIDQAGNVTFKETVKTVNFAINKADKTTFDKAVDIITFTDDSVTPGDNGKIIFSNGGSITNAVTFNTTNEVSITGSDTVPMNFGASSSYANLYHLTGDTKINGTLNAAQIKLGTTFGTTTITNGTINGSKFEVGDLSAEGHITTSGDQKYNDTVALTNELSLKSNTSSITFAQAITGAQTLSVESSTGTTFGGDVGTQTTPLSTLTVAGPVILTTTPATHKIFANEISFGSSSTINGETALEITSSTGTTFGADVGTDAARLTSLKITGPSTIGCSNIYTSGTQSFNGDVTLAQNVTLNTNDTTNGNISFGSKVDSKSGETHSVTIKIPTQRAAEFTGKVGGTTAPSVIIDQAGNVTFKETVKAENFTINKADNTTFDKTVTITTFTDDSLAPGDNGKIIFSNGGSITNAVTFNTTNEVSITGSMNIGVSPSYANLSHLTGDTKITGTFNAAQIILGTTSGTTTITSGTINGSKFEVGNLNTEGQITTSSEQKYNGTVALTNALSLKSNASSITFAQTITGAKPLSAESSTGTTFGGDVGTQTTPLASLTVKGPSTIGCSNIYTSGTQSFGGDVTLSEDVTLNTNDTTNGNISFGSKVDSKSGETHSVTIKIPTQRSVEFTGKVGGTTAPSVTIDQAGDVSFSETVKAVNLTINEAVATIFDKAVDINTFADDTAHTGNIIFKAGADIATATHLYTTGDITLTGTLSLPSLEINNLIADGSAAIETTAATGTQTYHGTINGKSVRTDNLTLSSAADITFDAGIGQARALKTFDLTGPAKLSSNIAVTADDVTFNTSLGSTTSAVRNLTIKDCNTLTNPTAASTVSNVDFIFTGAADRQTAFNPGASEYKNITTDTIELNLGSNSFKQNSDSDFKITSGTVKAGTGGLTAGNLIVSGGDFIQTGVAADQVNDITLTGGSITWDSTAQGGSLTINGVVTEANDLQINYNKKSVSFAHDNTISGIFWNLTIDSGRTITNGGRIRVRKNFTINGNYVHNNEPIIFGLDLTAPETDSTENGTITDNASSNIGKAYINKGASYKQTAATNLIFKDLEITSGTFENPDGKTTDTEILTNTAAATIANAGTLEVTRTFTDNGTYTGTGMLKFTGTSTQTFEPGTSTYSNIENTSANPLNVSRDIKGTNLEIKSGKATTFAATSKIDTLTITSASETTFTGSAAITNFDDTSHTGNITFKNGGTISTATVIHTTGNVTLTSTLTLPSLQMNNLIVDGTANINTNGDQIYDGIINGKTALTDILNLDSIAGHITFNGDIGQTLPLQTLDVQGETTINCEAITTSGSQTYNDAITLGASPAPETHTLTASGISFVSTIDGGAELIISTTEGSNFADDIGALTALTSLTVEGPVTIDCDSITTSGNQHYKGALVFETSPRLTSSGANLTFDSTIDGENTITLDVPNKPANTITVAGKVGETNIPSVKIAQAGNASFAQTVKAADFTITKANNTTFAKAVNITNFKITQAETTTFDELVQITNFTDAANAGDITFKNGGTIATASQFKTSGTVTFGDAAADTMNIGSASPYENLTHTAGNTNITGILNAAQITLAQTAGGPMTITNSGLFKTVDGTALSYTTSFAQNGSGNSIIGGSFTGNGNASFATNVQLYGSSQADFGSADKNISIAKDLIVIRDASDDLTINSNVSVSQNLVLYKGPVLADGNITVDSDILVLGSAYSEKDNSTGIADEYSYYCLRPDTWSQPNYTETLLPDASARPVGFGYPSSASGTPDFTGTLSVSSGKTISAAKNFYANGTTLQTAGTTDQWILKLPDLTNAANAFAEAYYSEISGCKVICNDGSSTDGTKSRLVCLECDDTGTTNTPNTNVDFDDFEITAAYTERDNAIRVEFNRPFRFNSYTVDLLKFHDSSDAVSAGTNFTGLYADPDCQTPIEIGDNANVYFYIKAAPQDSAETGAWNTDATGKTSGASDGQSTDRNGKHHTALPCLDFPRALQASTSGQTYTVPFILTDVWGKRLNNYSRRVTKGSTAEAAYGSANSSNDLLDKTGPVLWKVRTGQELHNAYDTSTGQASEHSYDAHNFIEFLYSEKVDFDGDETTNAPLNADPATAENVKVTDSFGALQNSNIEIAGALNFAGLGTIQNGLLWTGSAGVSNKGVNALYRKGTKAEYSIRLSIAGYTEGTVTDPDGNTYKKWIGYIEKAQMPTGTVTHIADSNTFVKDKEGNPQIKYEALNMIPEVDSTEDGLYGKWDLSEPVFAAIRPYKDDKLFPWASSLFALKAEYEAIGNTSGVGSTLDRIEFHLHDNTPQFESTSPEWFSEVGWCSPGSNGTKDELYISNYSFAADIFGGARPFDEESGRRTSGGIRYSSIHSSATAFSYGVGIKLSDPLLTEKFDIDKPAYGGATSLVFTGASSPRRSAGDLEGLYFALPLKSSTQYDISKSFTINYNDEKGFITDLAGNRLRSNTISTIDRTPPSIDMTIAPIGSKDLQIIFVKKLQTEIDKIQYLANDNTGTQIPLSQNSVEELLPLCFDFIRIDASGAATIDTSLKVDLGVPAEIETFTNTNDASFTKVTLALNRTITLEDIKNLYLRIKYVEEYGELSTDLFTSHTNSRVTFIQDYRGNNIQMYTAHALSDFAVGVIDPLYAYDSAMTEEDGTIISDSLLHQNLTEDVDRDSWSVHDWNRDQKNYGTLPAKCPLAIVADTTDGTLENTDAPASFRLYLSNNPDKDSVSTQYNKDLEPDPQWRIWLPNEMTGVFTSLSEKNNENYSQVDGSLLSDDISNRLIFDIGQSITNLWTAGNQISFLFGLTNSDGSPVTIMHSPELDINNDKQYLPTSAKMPLFALRQTEPDDLLSLDLWSFRLKDVVSQRGGVTILNNVINSSQREKVVVKVNQPQQGNLTVLVMTLDGSIVDYLHRGSSDAGEHFYSWDGTNRRGHSVARGMYFIRVTGPGIDETRKVMVVKD